MKDSENMKIVPLRTPDFSMGDAQELVNSYVMTGRYMQALRLLRCMEEKARYDVETLTVFPLSVGDTAINLWLQYDFIPDIQRQSEEIRNKLRSGT